MKRINMYIILLTCCISSFLNAQVTIANYKEMYDIVIDSLDINCALVSDTIMEIDYFGFDNYRNMKQDSTYNYRIDNLEYFPLLQSIFTNIEDNVYFLDSCNNIIYFSFVDNPYVRADCYIDVKMVSPKDKLPLWGHYVDLYSFLFCIKDERVVLLKLIQIFEM